MRGPGAAAYDGLGPDFYPRTLVTYYAHVSVLLRTDFLSDPDGPVPVLHLVDEATPPILWGRGEDLRLHPDLLGPLVVAGPWTDRTPLLTDGNLATSWASDDEPREHHVEVALPERLRVTRLALHWPEWRGRFRSSPRYRIEGEGAGGWQLLADVVDGPEQAWSVHDLEPAVVDRVRLVQPPGGGFDEHPNRLWLTQVELLGG